jgi:hypothetical protein
VESIACVAMVVEVNYIYSLSTLMYSDSQLPISKPAEMVDDVEKKYGAKDWEEFDRLE